MQINNTPAVAHHYNPDVLSCLANLSNDEVFTPPEIANKMLDTLPPELFKSKNTKFLDPFTKSGVFLREIAKRLIEGLADKIPDLEERVQHIMQHQLYGIGITELTALLARRTLYCAKKTNEEYSVAQFFENEDGNIHFSHVQHTWEKGRCIHCGASQDLYDREDVLETHAYHFIHNKNPFQKMKFDVIIGNPPYQLNVGNTGGNISKAKAIYHLFIEQAIKMQPHYLCMIVPSRWMTKSTEGIPESWVDKMINSNKFVEIHDFENSADCFPGVTIEGGVNYFLWQSTYNEKCRYLFCSDSGTLTERIGYLDPNKVGIIIRDKNAFEIIDKISKIEKNYINKKNFSELVSPKDFFTNKQLLTSKWNGFQAKSDDVHYIKYYLNKQNHDVDFGWISEKQIPKNIKSKKLHKVYIPAAHGGKEKVLGTPFYGEPNSVCSQTYLVIGYDVEKHNFTKEECINIISYIKTRFFRYLVSIKKKTQNGPRGVYQFVPQQDFSKSWTDEELYKKYGLTEEEINYIESMIRPME